MLHPEDGDRPEEYDTIEIGNPLTGEPCQALRQRPNGACIYLGIAGCTIHGRAPALCREFDCRRFFGKWLSGEIQQSIGMALHAKDVLVAGRARYSTLEIDE